MRAAALFAAFVLPIIATGAATQAIALDKGAKSSAKTVTFTVQSVDYFQNGLVLNSRHDYRVEGNIAVYIEPSVVSALKRTYDEPLHRVFRGREVTVEERYGRARRPIAEQSSFRVRTQYTDQIAVSMIDQIKLN